MYVVLIYFMRYFTRQCNSPCIVTLPSSGLDIGTTLPTTKLWRVSTPDSTPSFYFGTAVCIFAPKMSRLDTQCNLEMACVQKS